MAQLKLNGERKQNRSSHWRLQASAGKAGQHARDLASAPPTLKPINLTGGYATKQVLLGVPLNSLVHLRLVGR